MKLALVLFTEVSCQRFVCSVEIWFLLNPWKTDQAFAWPDWHRWDVHLGHAREGCQLCCNTRGLGWLNNQTPTRWEDLDRTLLTLLFHHALSTSDAGYFRSSTHWTFKEFLSCCCFIRNKMAQLRYRRHQALYCQEALILVCVSLIHT